MLDFYEEHAIKQAGFNAGLAGKKPGANPHPASSEAHTAWHEGHFEGWHTRNPEGAIPPDAVFLP